MKPITIDPQLQSVLEHLIMARKEFNKAFRRFTDDEMKMYVGIHKDFMTGIQEVISGTIYLGSAKIESDLYRGKYDINQEGSNDE